MINFSSSMKIALLVADMQSQKSAFLQSEVFCNSSFSFTYFLVVTLLQFSIWTVVPNLTPLVRENLNEYERFKCYADLSNIYF